MSAALLVAAKWGWETQVFKNKNMVIGRMFLLRAQAEAFAAEQRQHYERHEIEAAMD